MIESLDDTVGRIVGMIDELGIAENELYHTGRDIGETKNVADEHPELAKQLETRAREWMDDANAPRMTPNPNYDANWKANR